ncbi:hypothetical protein B0A50_00423 [Salinomyces thailandicus]|uniref:Uncharacterized protein n=1 Tax=Salinomyces thailandicus TaxID=706561 RepID=A0A4U0UE94_9PEZI|nr:hypothetical protein B0A50_00423 [Salinomyces thailandica]
MSKFFRTSSTDSTSSGEQSTCDSTEGTEDLSIDVNQPDTSADLATAALNNLSVASQAPSDGWRREMLLHALLEERCMNEVLRQQEGKPRRQRLDDAAVRTEARARYQRLCATLAPRNLIFPGLELDGLSVTRQQYRDGLDAFASSNTGVDSQWPQTAPLRRMLTDRETQQCSTNAPQPLGLARLESDASSVAESLSPAHALLPLSRYVRDFDQIGVLGKGGYGTVYRVKHKLDDIQYAIKVVPISPARMARIRSRGQAELDEILLEIRTLARLDHPNIVRYFGGWIEWSNVSGAAQTSELSELYGENGGIHRVWSEVSDSSRVSDEGNVRAGAEDSGSSLGREVTQSASEGAEIVFESSLPSQDAVALQPSVSDRNMRAVSKSTTEAFDSANQEFATVASGPALALHLQMALYPLTLGDYLNSSSDNVTSGLHHCFHVQPSISILLAILDGVEYLHNEGIVHRDLKPANIFLAEYIVPSTVNGSVDLRPCESCSENGKANATPLKVRIGDFGLVTALAQPEQAAVHDETKAVGTEIYRPVKATSYASAGLDIYALAIVLFELLWCFSTRMERQDTLRRLKDDHFPDDFCQRIGDPNGDVRDCIRDMLSQDQDVLTIASLKHRLRTIAASVGLLH